MKAITKKLNGRCNQCFVAIFLSLLLCSVAGFAGSGLLRLPVTVSTSHPAGDWVLDKTVSNVDFYHAINVCNGKNVVMLKFVNRNAGTVKVGWKEAFVTRERVRVEGFAGRKEMILQPGITTPADCADVSNKKIVIKGADVDPMSVIDIVSFNYLNITVVLQ